jgi:hypothetical protein
MELRSCFHVGAAGEEDTVGLLHGHSVEANQPNALKRGAAIIGAGNPNALAARLA